MKAYQRQPCAECPWRLDVAPGQFPPARFVALAKTAYDVAIEQFACHKSPEAAPIGCAGFVLQGSTHNLGTRLALHFGKLKLDEVSSPWPLHPNYRAMAIAQGVPADHPALAPCRDDV